MAIQSRAWGVVSARQRSQSAVAAALSRPTLRARPVACPTVFSVCHSARPRPRTAAPRFESENFRIFEDLDNTEGGRWGYVGPVELDWLKMDLKRTQARSVFVFLHFPVWEAERVAPKYHEFWVRTLHPLFRESRVRAVFGGHLHSYGPTREYDGIFGD